MILRLFFFAYFILVGECAFAADLTVLAPPALSAVMDDIVPTFEAKGGRHVVILQIDDDSVEPKVLSGAHFDLAIVEQQMVPGLTRSGRITPRAIPVARTMLGLAVPNGSAKPDISTQEAFERTVMSAQSIAFSAPAPQSLSDQYLRHCFAHLLGLTNQSGVRQFLAARGHATDYLTTGQAGVAVAWSHDLRQDEDVRYVGPLPETLQMHLVFTAVTAQDSALPDSARAFLSLMSGPDGALALERHGLERP